VEWRNQSKIKRSSETTKRLRWSAATVRSIGLCWPRSDSAACFAALLGTPENGRWLIAREQTVHHVNRRHRPGTLVLETEFQTETGCAVIVDFMLPADDAQLVRIAIGRSARVEFRTEFVVRFNYAAMVP
jgi:GH15 family glucan-1,4-alpha-glucosidase